MKGIFDIYKPGEAIPVQQYLKNRKLAKYFNRETAAAIVCAAKLLKEAPVHSETPFYYETGTMEFEDLGFDRIAAASIDEKGHYNQKLFVEKGVAAVPPITQFKALYNMPLSFVSIELGLTGENAVIYASARALLVHVLHAPRANEVLIGCGKAFQDGHLESGFAIVNKDDVAASPYLSRTSTGEAVEMFRRWAEEGLIS